MSRKVNIYRAFAAGCADADVANFLAATGISDTVIEDALCDLVTSLKSANLWTKLNAIYPVVGGAAATHKFNLKNPADADAAYRLAFMGGWVHSANGAQPNGINAYANTFYSHSLLNSASLVFYSRTNSDGLFNDIGCATSTVPNSILIPRFSNAIFGHINQSTNLSAANTNSTGRYIVTRTASNVVKTFKNGSVIINGTTSSTSIPTNPVLISAFFQSSGFISRYSNREWAFAAMGEGLNDSEAAALDSIIDTFNTALGR